VCARAPLADAGPDSDVPYHAPFTLDGTRSTDPDKLPLSYEWAVTTQPAGSTATLNDPTAAQPTFLPDLEGRYVLSLTVADPYRSSEPAWVVVHAVNYPPVAVVSPASSNMYTGTMVLLDGSGSYDPNNDPLTYSWVVIARPLGSVAMPATPTAPTTTFTPDVDGPYTIDLVVNDGLVSSPVATASIQSFRAIAGLSFRPIDAEYSTALDQIIMVATAPDALYIYDPVGATATPVSLGATPVAVSVAPDGLHAVVAHASSLTWVDLQTAKVVTTYSVSTVDASDIVYTGSGVACVTPGPGTSDPSLRNILLSNGTETVISFAYQSPNATAVAGGAADDTVLVYEASTAAGANLAKLDTSTGLATFVTRTPYGLSGSYANLWASDDALYFISSLGAMTRVSDLAGTKSISPPQSISDTIVHAATASTRSVAFAIWKYTSTAYPEDEAVSTYAYPALGYPTQTTQLPDFVVNNTGYPSHGRFVFVRSDQAHYYVVMQADPSAGLTDDYGVVTYSF
jgi:hypothetical protein